MIDGGQRSTDEHIDSSRSSQAGRRWSAAYSPSSAVTHDWYAVYDLRPRADAFAICEPHHNEEVISFLLIGRERALLVDTGMGFVPIKPIVRRLTQLPITVLNTHSHFDHTGGNWEFDGVLTFDTPLARARQSDGERASWAGQLRADLFFRAPPAGLDPTTHTTRPYRIEAFVRDGESIDLGGRVFEVLHTPGHSADSIALLERGNRLLLTADTFYEGPIFLTNGDSDVADFARSTQRLAGLATEIDWLLPSHNAPLAPATYLAPLADAAARFARENERVGLDCDGFQIVMG